MTGGFEAGDGGGPAPEVALVGFARAARAAGLPVTPDRTRAYLRAVATVGAGDARGVYWAGRATLCSDPDHLERYDRVFRDWFSAAARPAGARGSRPVRVAAGGRPVGDGGAGTAGDPSAGDAPVGDPSAGVLPAGDGGGERAADGVVRARASGADLLRHRDVAGLTPAERRRLVELFALIRPVPPLRRALRRVPSRTGRPDPARTLREQLRRVGEPGPVRYRRPARRPRRVVLVVDVSGSMAPYADVLLRLAHVWVRSAPRTTEAFTVGTRLTRVTAALRHRDPEVALRTAGEQVPDWSGGTRLGEVLQAFLDRWGRRGTARGAVVVLFSDGWERGDPALLGDQMARLHRLAHRVVWVNPHAGKPGYRPVQGGIVAALPFVDALLAGHSMATFGELVGVVGRA